MQTKLETQANFNLVQVKKLSGLGKVYGPYKLIESQAYMRAVVFGFETFHFCKMYFKSVLINYFIKFSNYK